MSSSAAAASAKKDINVNTLFPQSLLQQLDEWAWSMRMTRSAALRSLVEYAFEHMQQDTLSTSIERQPAHKQKVELPMVDAASLSTRIAHLEAALDVLRHEMALLRTET